MQETLTDSEKLANVIAAVKRYLAYQEDDLCQFNRNELAAACGLEEPINPAVLDPLVMLGGCVKYCQSLQNGKDYVNPNTGVVYKHPNCHKG